MLTVGEPVCREGQVHGNPLLCAWFFYKPKTALQIKVYTNNKLKRKREPEKPPSSSEGGAATAWWVERLEWSRWRAGIQPCHPVSPAVTWDLEYGAEVATLALWGV